jgi:hypothetical protein
MSTALVHQDQAAQGQLEAAHPAPGTLEAITRSEIDTQIATAKRYPRSVARFRQNALTLATIDPETAASCGYALKRGGKLIEGPSIRLAEMVSVSWTNLRYGGRIIAEEQAFLVAQGFAHDMEANVAATVEVRRRITDKDGRRYSEDMVGVTAQAAIAIATRNAIFKVVPRALVDTIYRDAKKHATGEGNEKTVAQRRQAAVDHFTKKLGVPKAKLFEYLSGDGKNVAGIEDIGVPELEILHGLLTAIKDGDTTLGEAFGMGEGARSSSPLAGAAAPPPAGAAPAAAASSGPVVDAQHEPAAAAGAQVVDTAAELLKADIRATKSSTELKKLGKVLSTQPKALQDQVQPVYDQVMLDHKGREAAAQKGQG